ncbi:MAG: hypothetical protein AB7O49_11845 [Sphingomonadales bacterium]
MTAQRSRTIVTLFRKRSRRDLVEMLVRAHRNGDEAMTETCRAELDRRSLESRQAGRAAG